MAKNNEIYVDTGSFISFLDRSDTYHSLFNQLFSEKNKLISTPMVVTEGHGWFLRRYDPQRALQFLSFIESMPHLNIMPVDNTMLQKAYGILRKYSDQHITLTDSLGIWLMKNRKIKVCWTTDRLMGLEGARISIYN